MGTRNLTAVVLNGEYKIAQYGQWDGYPSEQGSAILSFLAGPGNVEKLRANLAKVRFSDPNGRDKEMLESYDANAPTWSTDPDKRTPEQKRWFETYISRDIGGDILAVVADSEDAEIILRSSIEFASDSLFCEWAYVVDLDNGTFEVYRGFNHKPVPAGERFSLFSLRKEAGDDEQYYPIRHVKTYDLAALPEKDAFVKECDPPEEEEAA